jgi:hypothetical protein
MANRNFYWDIRLTGAIVPIDISYGKLGGDGFPGSLFRVIAYGGKRYLKGTIGYEYSHKGGAMASEITIKGQKARRGERMRKGRGWRIAAISGRKRVFVGTLLHTINVGKKRLAIFSVPK